MNDEALPALPEGFSDWKNTVRVEMLKDTHTHHGKKVSPGDIVELPRAVADFLCEFGVSRIAQPVEPAPPVPARKPHTRKPKTQPQPAL